MPDLVAVDAGGQQRAVGSTTNAYAVAGDRRDLEAPRPAVLVVRADFDLGAGRKLGGGRVRHVRRAPMLGPSQSTMPDLPGLIPRQTSSISESRTAQTAATTVNGRARRHRPPNRARTSPI